MTAIDGWLQRLLGLGATPETIGQEATAAPVGRVVWVGDDVEALTAWQAASEGAVFLDLVRKDATQEPAPGRAMLEGALQGLSRDGTAAFERSRPGLVVRAHVRGAAR